MTAYQYDNLKEKFQAKTIEKDLKKMIEQSSSALTILGLDQIMNDMLGVETEQHDLDLDNIKNDLYETLISALEFETENATAPEKKKLFHKVKRTVRPWNGNLNKIDTENNMLVKATLEGDGVLIDIVRALRTLKTAHKAKESESQEPCTFHFIEL